MKNNNKYDLEALLNELDNKNNEKTLDPNAREEITQFVLMLNEELENKKLESNASSGLELSGNKFSKIVKRVQYFYLSKHLSVKYGITFAIFSVIAVAGFLLIKNNTSRNYDIIVRNNSNSTKNYSDKFAPVSAPEQTDELKKFKENIVDETVVISASTRSYIASDSSYREIIDDNLRIIQIFLKKYRYIPSKSNDAIISEKEFKIGASTYQVRIKYNINENENGSIKLKSKIYIESNTTNKNSTNEIKSIKSNLLILNNLIRKNLNYKLF